MMGTLRTLFLNPPSYAGFDGGAGSRYQACREVRSYWYPTWLAQPAAMIANSKLIDAPANGLNVEQVLQMAKGFELCVIHTAAPSFSTDARVAEALKRAHPDMTVGFVGAHVAVLTEESLRAAPALDFVAREEFDYSLLEIAQGTPLAQVPGISFRQDGAIRRNPDREIIKDVDALPSVLDIYKRDLKVENYCIGYLQHPYLSLRTYRARSAANMIAEMARAKELFPQVKEFFFDDDTFTADLPRAACISRGLGRLGLTWSCNARANVPHEYLKIFKENGLRLLLVGYESGNQHILDNVHKGLRLDVSEEFSRSCRTLGILVHGTFVLGLPGETRETIAESIRYACRLDIDTIQVSPAAPYPGMELYRQAMADKCCKPGNLARNDRAQSCALSYSDLSAADIQAGVKRFYARFYARPTPIWRMLARMTRDPEERRRRLREGREFLRYLGSRTSVAA